MRSLPPQDIEVLPSAQASMPHPLGDQMLQESCGCPEKESRNSAFEALLAEISAEFINLPIVRLDEAFEQAQRRICECFGFDTSILWLWSGQWSGQGTAEHPRSLLIHMHSPPGGPPRPLQLDARQALPWTYRQSQQGLTFTVVTDDLPAEAVRDRETRRLYGIESSVVIPLKTGGKPVIGVLCFGTLKKRSDWSIESLKRLELVAQLFGNALARKRHEELLQESETRLRLALQELEERQAEVEALRHQLEGESIRLRVEPQQGPGGAEIIGNGEAFHKVMAAARQVAATDATVLILGETGTGKGIFARAIHQMSARRNRTFLTVNCAALPAGLMESELFGREKGAFTGAHARQAGRFEAASHGTIFLDEIGELSLELQAKLLRVLQDGEFERLGGTRTLRTDARVIAATARDLGEEVAGGRFRQDLFYRLNVFPITIPPLRQRPEDILPLIVHFIKRYNRLMGRQVATIARSTLDKLLHYGWPGNVRELEHLVERCLIVSPGTAFILTDQLNSPAATIAGEEPGQDDLASVERHHIRQVLRATKWKIEGPGGAAAILDLHPSTLRFRMRKLGINRPV